MFFSSERTQIVSVSKKTKKKTGWWVGARGCNYSSLVMALYLELLEEMPYSTEGLGEENVICWHWEQSYDLSV